jgi:hypothetical protein
MNNLPLASRNTLPVILLGAVILVALLCIAHLGYGQDTWLLPNWNLPYAGCSNWCS